MQRITFIILFLISLNIFGQKSEIENLVNQVASDEVSGNFEYYLLVSQSLEQPKVYDSIQNYHIKEFRTANKKVIEDLYYKQTQEKIDWKNYALKKTRLVNNENFPPTSKHVLFVEYNINEKVYDSLLVNRNSQTLVVKKKWFWSKKKIWSNKKFHKEILKAWELDKEKNPEENIYFEFSKPIFSDDKKFARITINKNGRCGGIGFTALYKNENGKWRKLIEYNKNVSVVAMSHSRCGDVSILIYN